MVAAGEVDQASGCVLDLRLPSDVSRRIIGDADHRDLKYRRAVARTGAYGRLVGTERLHLKVMGWLVRHVRASRCRDGQPAASDPTLIRVSARRAAGYAPRARLGRRYRAPVVSTCAVAPTATADQTTRRSSLTGQILRFAVQVLRTCQESAQLRKRGSEAGGANGSVRRPARGHPERQRAAVQRPSAGP